MNQRGHLGLALLFASPGVAFFGFYESMVAGIVFGIATISVASLPDIDQSSWLPVSHRGITHTVWFVGVVAIVGGAIGGYWLFVTLRWFQPVGDLVTWLPASPAAVYSLPAVPSVLALQALVGAGLLVGGLSHLLGDALTIGAGAYAITPYWPLSDSTVRFGFFPASSTFYNVLFAVAGILSQLGVFLLLLTA